MSVSDFIPITWIQKKYTTHPGHSLDTRIQKKKEEEQELTFHLVGHNNHRSLYTNHVCLQSNSMVRANLDSV